MQRLQPLQNYYSPQNIKIAKIVPKRTLQPACSCSIKEKAPKNNEYQTILKLDKTDQYAKAIAFEK